MHWKFAAIVFSLSTGLYAQQMVMFDCNSIPGVCNNMCWGAFCKDNFQALTHTAPGPNMNTVKIHRKNAGYLPSPNRCSVLHKPPHIKGYECDEYPFASSTTTNKRPIRVNRCVPATQNHRSSEFTGIVAMTDRPTNVVQGKTLMKFYGNCGVGCNFDVVFQHPGNARYCGVPAGTSNCDNDGHEVAGPNNMMPYRNRRYKSLTFTRGDTSPANGVAMLYRLQSGREVIAPPAKQVGEEVTRVVAINETLYEAQIEAEILAGRDAMSMTEDIADNLRFEYDAIVAVVESYPSSIGHESF